MNARPAGDHPTLLSRLGGGIARRPGTVVSVWAVLVVAAFGLSLGLFGTTSLFDRLESGSPEVAGENTRGYEVLADAGQSATSTHILQVTGVDTTSPQTAQAVTAFVQGATGKYGVETFASPWTVPGGPTGDVGRTFLLDGQATADGGFAVVATFGDDVTMDEQSTDRPALDREFEDLVADLPGATGSTGGLSALIDAITHQVETDLQTGEGIALPISFIVMVLVFGGFLAAGMPIIGAIASIGGALAALLGFSFVLDLDATVVNVVTILGLGLCIDYGLLVVSRFREELRAIAQGRPASDITRDEVVTATARTVDRAGRTVVFSALTVAISLGGLLVFEATILRAIGSAALSVVLVAMVVALTLVPALCALGAKRLLRKGTEQAPEEGVFSRLARWVHRYPWPVIVGVVAVLVTLALPAFDMRLTSSGKELLPVENSQRQFFTDLETGYPALAGPDLQVVLEAPVATAQAYAAALPEVGGEPLRGVASAVSDDVSVVDVDVAGGPQGDEAREAVRALQADRPDATSYVVGQASGLQDFTDSTLERAPWAFALVALATLVLLFLMTGSLVIPVKALLLNVVSLGACLGVVVWIFENGHLEGLLGFDSVGGVESVIPMLILAFGFGLSMDYEVFLLSRVIELHEQGADNDTAVVQGLQRSGRIITSAAILVVIVFSGFIAGDLLIIKETGVGLAVAVLIDATLVRMLLVPATMTVLGDRNWWAPRRLRGLHARFGITE